MIDEQTSQGRQIRFRARGVGRFLGAAFLGLWLCGWAAGECFAVWIVYRGAVSLATGQPPTSGGDPVPLPAMIGIGIFLFFWLFLWTLGGILAMREMLRLLWCEDRLTVHGGGLAVHQVIGPFTSTREIPRDTIRDVLLMPRGRLVARTDRGTVDLTQLGTVVEREQAAVALRTELGIADSTAEGGPLPKEWEEVITPEGERVATPALGTRRTQARVAMIAAMAFATVALIVTREATVQLALIPGAILLLAATGGLTWGAIWLARGRTEWRIGSGRLTLRKRFNASVRDIFEARRLELSTSTDSDGDEWLHLDALASADAEPAGASHHWVQKPSKNRRRIASAMNDPTLPRQLGVWLARTADMPLDDRSAPKAKAMELAELRSQLEKSGTLGRIAARFIDRLADRQGRKSA